MSRRSLSPVLGLVLVLGALLRAAPVAASSAPLPASMAAVGDSISQAASSGGSLGADYPANAWATGTNASVNSHLARLRALDPSVTAANLSVSGAKVADLAAQMQAAVALQPDYLTVLIGGNDICTSSEATMTSVADFRDRFEAAMATLSAGSASTHVYVVSIPRVTRLWELFRGSWWARFVWSVGNVCQSLLANPTSTAQADVDRRARVHQRNVDFNAVLADVCGATARCHWDGGAVFGTTFTASDVSGDYFHPSIAGQAKLAAVSWEAGYDWTLSPPPNEAPVASFTDECEALTCDFSDTSTDADGTIVTRAWDFGDGSGSSAATTAHTYAGAGTYAVSLTVTDDDGASSTVTRSVTVVSAPPPSPSMRIGDLAGSGATVSSRQWRATVQVTVTDLAGAPVAGAAVTGGWSVGSPDSCTTGPAGTCSVTSDSLRTNKVTSVTFTITGASHATYVYAPSANVETSISISRP
jgi:PKD repeat protein